MTEWVLRLNGSLTLCGLDVLTEAGQDLAPVVLRNEVPGAVDGVQALVWDGDGGYARQVVATADYAFDRSALGDRSAASIAPLICAGVIGYRALKIAGVTAGETGRREGCTDSVPQLGSCNRSCSIGGLTCTSRAARVTRRTRL